MISFIIVNYNTYEPTLMCVESIFERMQGQAVEVIVVDNASADGSREGFSSLRRPGFKYVYNDENLGFGVACNIGARYATGKYIFLINSDARLLSLLTDARIDELFAAAPGVGILAPRVTFPDGREQVTTGNYSSLSDVLFRLLRLGALYRRHKWIRMLSGALPFKPRNVAAYVQQTLCASPAREVDWASGCALILSRENYERLGGFDEGYFLYSEDEDLCLRAARLGLRTRFTPELQIEHVLGGSGSPESRFITTCKLDGWARLFARRLPGKRLHLHLIYLMAGIVLAPFTPRGRVVLAWLWTRKS
jgi:hypothetical protein